MPTATKQQKLLEDIRARAEKRKQALEQNYVKPSEAAEATGLHTKTILRCIREKRLPAQNIGTVGHPDYRIHRDDMVLFIERGESRPHPRRKGK